MINIFKKKKYNQNIPVFWNNYLSFFTKDAFYKKPIDESKFVVFDIETTGLNIKKDKMLSIGALTVIRNEIDVNNSLELYVEQENLSYGAIPIHGIINNSGKGLTEYESVKQFIEYTGDSILVGHNINFDISFINQILKKSFNDSLKNKSLDTFNLYHRLSKGERLTKSQSSLDGLCKTFNIPASDRHTALGDAYITAVLFLKFLSRLKKRGVETVDELLKDRTRIL